MIAIDRLLKYLTLLILRRYTTLNCGIISNVSWAIAMFNVYTKSFFQKCYKGIKKFHRITSLCVQTWMISGKSSLEAIQVTYGYIILPTFVINASIRIKIKYLIIFNPHEKYSLFQPCLLSAIIILRILRFSWR